MLKHSGRYFALSLTQFLQLKTILSYYFEPVISSYQTITTIIIQAEKFPSVDWLKRAAFISKNVPSLGESSISRVLLFMFGEQ